MSECNKIAVVIPLYNKAPHIAQTLDSVLAQTCTAAEIIVVDDGSEDGGGQIVENYASRGVTLVRQKNQGESAARNAGILAASAEYVAFLDADDHWKPNHLATLHELILRYPHAGLLSTAHLFYRGGNAFRPRSAFPDGWVGEVPDFFMAYRSGLCLVNSSTACSKRWAILQIGGFPVGVRRGSDIITWIKLALAFPVAHAEVVTSVYNRDGVNRSEFISEAEPPGSLKFIHEVLQDKTLDKQKLKSIGLLFDRIAIFTAAGFQINGDRKGVINILRLAFASSRYMCALVVGSIACFPIGVLCLIRSLRHRRVHSRD